MWQFWFFPLNLILMQFLQRIRCRFDFNFDFFVRKFHSLRRMPVGICVPYYLRHKCSRRMLEAYGSNSMYISFLSTLNSYNIYTERVRRSFMLITLRKIIDNKKAAIEHRVIKVCKDQ